MVSLSNHLRNNSRLIGEWRMPTKNPLHPIDISYKVFIKFFLVVGGALLLYILSDVLAALLFAVVIASAMEPVIFWFKKYKIPRIAGVIIIYLAVFLIFAVIFYFYALWPIFCVSQNQRRHVLYVFGHIVFFTSISVRTPNPSFANSSFWLNKSPQIPSVETTCHCFSVIFLPVAVSIISTSLSSIHPSCFCLSVITPIFCLKSASTACIWPFMVSFCVSPWISFWLPVFLFICPKVITTP